MVRIFRRNCGILAASALSLLALASGGCAQTEDDLVSFASGCVSSDCSTCKDCVSMCQCATGDRQTCLESCGTGGSSGTGSGGSNPGTGGTSGAGASGGSAGTGSGGVSGGGTGGSGAGAGGSTGGGTSTGGSAGTGGMGGYQPDEVPYFTTPEELCGYVNSARQTSNGHERYRGAPGRGEYHSVRTWPTIFTVDAALMVEAQAEADRLAAGGSLKGSAHTSAPWIKPLYLDGVDTPRYTISTREEPGDWKPTYKAGLINSNGSARMSLYYHDPGGIEFGPKLNRVGCGGASIASGARFWVVILKP